MASKKKDRRFSSAKRVKLKKASAGAKRTELKKAIADTAPKLRKVELETSEDVGIPKCPEGPGFMALTAAAHWIASQGGTLAVGKGEQFWKQAFGDLLAHIASQHIEVIGRRGTGNESVPAVLFAGIRVLYPYSDPDRSILNTMFGKEPVLNCSPFTEDEEQWQEINDKLYASGRDDVPQWTHLQVKKSDVIRFWPAKTTTQEPGVVEAATSTPVTAREPEQAARENEPADLSLAATMTRLKRNREKLDDVKKQLRAMIDAGKMTVDELGRNKDSYGAQFGVSPSTYYNAAREVRKELGQKKN
jgi:hypothetical protein